MGGTEEYRGQSMHAGCFSGAKKGGKWSYSHIDTCERVFCEFGLLVELLEKNLFLFTGRLVFGFLRSMHLSFGHI